MLLRIASTVVVLALAAPAFGIEVFSPSDPSLQGTVIASQTVVIPSLFVLSEPALLVDEKVVQTGEGTLDFYYKVLNPPNQSGLLHGFGVEFPGSSSLHVDIGYLDEGNLAPSDASITTQGSRSEAGYRFGPDRELDGVPLPDAGTDWLILRSNAFAYTVGPIGGYRMHDDQLRPANGLAPDASSVPEPAAFVLLSSAVVGLAVRFRRR